ncbi:MAG: MFS transporter [Alphaproteobacteria bacterium]
MASTVSRWVERFRTPGVLVFVTMDTLDSFARASLVTVVPLQALAAFKSERDTSLAFTFGGVAGLIALFAIPWLTRTFRRRSVYTLGVLLVIATSAALATATQVGVTMAIFLRTFATSCIVITMNLYVLEFIRKRDFVRLEPLRIMAVGVPWTLGPYFGVWLYTEVGPLAIYGFSAACALVVLAYFWWVPLRGRPGSTGSRPPRTPTRSIARFAKQPRLRLAWLLAFGRSSWWSMYFIYVPLYMVQAGAGEKAGALLVSAGNALLLIAPVFGWLARRFHLRPVMMTAFAASGVVTIAAGLAGASPLIAAALLLVATVGLVCLDGLTVIPFYRAVHAYERDEMTTVYTTWRDISNLATPALCAVVLSFGPLPWVFVVMGALMFVFAYYTRYVPRGM